MYWNNLKYRVMLWTSVVIKGMITAILSSFLSDEIIVAVFVSQKGVSVELSHMINKRIVYVYIYSYYKRTPPYRTQKYSYPNAYSHIQTEPFGNVCIISPNLS
jgi:hypothetical protein